MTNKRTRREFLKSSALISAACLMWGESLDRQARLARDSSIPAQSSFKRFTAYQPEARELLARMTLEEKVGQMTQAEQDALKE
ncbi:MAG TPA: hypothetical protein VGO69_06910, partial [Pyrinomonadaceae bacterium]|nr:hypothetical protein [Pyrinomonadaceae bacterium]